MVAGAAAAAAAAAVWNSVKEKKVSRSDGCEFPNPSF